MQVKMVEISLQETAVTTDLEWRQEAGAEITDVPVTASMMSQCF